MTSEECAEIQIIKAAKKRNVEKYIAESRQKGLLIKEDIIMKNCLVLVDLQKGFMNKNTEAIPGKIKEFLLANSMVFSQVVSTRYINHEKTACYKFEGWKGCMAGTEDTELCEELDGLYSRVFEKDKYSCWNEEFKTFVKDQCFDKIYFVGVNTGCCVLHSILDCYNDVQDCTVISDLCGSTTGEDIHNLSLQILSTLITKERIITSDEL